MWLGRSTPGFFCYKDFLFKVGWPSPIFRCLDPEYHIVLPQKESSLSTIHLEGANCFSLPGSFFCIIPRKLTWNMKIIPLKGKIIFQTSMFGFHVSFRGCIHQKKSSTRQVLTRLLLTNVQAPSHSKFSGTAHTSCSTPTNPWQIVATGDWASHAYCRCSWFNCGMMLF